MNSHADGLWPSVRLRGHHYFFAYFFLEITFARSPMEPAMSDSLLLHDATPQKLEEAAALNHRELFVLTAEALGGEVREAEGVTWTFGGPKSDSMVCFPRLSEEDAGPT